MQVVLHRHPFLWNQINKNFTNRGFCTCTIVSGTLRTHNELPESIEQTGSTHLCDCRHAAFARYLLLNTHTYVITFILLMLHIVSCTVLVTRAHVRTGSQWQRYPSQMQHRGFSVISSSKPSGRMVRVWKHPSVAQTNSVRTRHTSANKEYSFQMQLALRGYYHWPIMNYWSYWFDSLCAKSLPYQLSALWTVYTRKVAMHLVSMIAI